MDLILSILVLAAIALVAGAVWLWRKGEHSKQAVLMLILAAIMIINVAIWTIPAGDGASPLNRIDEQVQSE